MKTILTIFITLIILSLSFITYASLDVTWSWTAPTEYDDNTIIEEGGITGYNLYCNDNAPISIPAPSLSHTENLAPGTYECYVTAWAHGKESEPSNSVTKIVEWPKPKPPILSLNQ